MADLRRAVEVALVGQRNEIFQLAQVHRMSDPES
jgi:hypothetical protein